MIFFNKFKCKHHFEWLCVEKEQTIKQKDDMYEIITYHLHCEKCNENIKLDHAKLKYGVDFFIKQSRIELDKEKK